MKKYSRVSYEVRCQIDAYLQAGFSVKEISKIVKFHKSTIYRELARNMDLKSYSPAKADKKAKKRYALCRKAYKIKPTMAGKIKALLDFGLSPEQISGRLKLELKKQISHECIYQYIHKKDQSLRVYLRRPRKRGFSRYDYNKAAHLPKNGQPVQKRPEIANNRIRIGDWERDLFYYAKGKHALVCTDRKSRYVKIAKVESRNSDLVASKTEELILSLPRRVYTITNDNGSEFKGRKLKIKCFFCDPMTPQQRGTVENMIGLIRQYVSRKDDIDDITLKGVENRLNHRPRKCLNFLTPFEVFFKTKVALAT